MAHYFRNKYYNLMTLLETILGLHMDFLIDDDGNKWKQVINVDRKNRKSSEVSKGR